MSIIKINNNSFATALNLGKKAVTFIVAKELNKPQGQVRTYSNLAPRLRILDREIDNLENEKVNPKKADLEKLRWQRQAIGQQIVREAKMNTAERGEVDKTVNKVRAYFRTAGLRSKVASLDAREQSLEFREEVIKRELNELIMSPEVNEIGGVSIGWQLRNRIINIVDKYLKEHEQISNKGLTELIGIIKEREQISPFGFRDARAFVKSRSKAALLRKDRQEIRNGLTQLRGEIISRSRGIFRQTGMNSADRTRVSNSISKFWKGLSQVA
jgi:hypothetical protein